MKTKNLLIWKVQLAFGSAILTLLVVGVVSYRVILAANDRARWARHAHEVLESIENLILSTENIESSYRGFVLTGKESYLGSYRSYTGVTQPSWQALELAGEEVL